MILNELFSLFHHRLFLQQLKFDFHVTIVEPTLTAAFLRIEQHINDISDESRLFKEVDSRNVVILYDGMALVHKFIQSFTAAKTFGDISKIVLATILKVPDELKHLEDMENVRIDLVMDRYSMNIEQCQRPRKK